MSGNNFRDLRVWKASMALVLKVYELTVNFPAQEMYGLYSQLRRAAVAIPSNIAEGHGREHPKEYLYHLSVAQGSLAELQTQIEIAEQLHYISAEQSQQAIEEAISVRRQLYALRNALARRGRPDDRES
jgi:four helix bundle protein